MDILQKEEKLLFTAPLHPFPENLRLLTTRKYFVSVKPDGRRIGILINEGIVYLIKLPYFTCYPIGLTQTQGRHIMDGEYIWLNPDFSQCKPYVILFDILTSQEEHLLCRQNQLQLLIHSLILKPTVNITTIKTKTYYHTELTPYVLTSHSSPVRDGVIFTPEKGLPSQGVIRFKINPTFSVRIEFALEYDYLIGESIRCYCMVRDNNRYLYMDTNSYIPKRIYINLNINELLVVKSNDNELKLSEGIYDIDFNSNLLAFRPDKLEPDTVWNIEKLGKTNGSDILCYILDIPISCYHYDFACQPIGYYILSKYHNEVKSIIYNKYLKGQILDVGTGTGTDIQKYLRNRKITRIDICQKYETSLEPKLRTEIDYIKRSSVSCSRYYKINDLTTQDRLYDVVVSSFSWHYLYEGQMITLMNKVTMGGYIIIFYLNGDNILGYNQTYHLGVKRQETDHDVGVSYHVYTSSPLIKPKYISITRCNQDHDYDETIINPGELTRQFTEHGFKKVIDLPFSEVLKSQFFPEHVYNVSVFQKIKTIFKRSYLIDQLCPDILNLIFGYLNEIDSYNFMITCKYLYSIAPDRDAIYEKLKKLAHLIDLYPQSDKIITISNRYVSEEDIWSNYS